MVKPQRRCLIAALLVLATPVAAQDTKPQAPGAQSPLAAPPRAAGPSPSGPSGLAGQPPPSTAAERAKLLANLYAYLATAEDEKQAQPVTVAIERLWLFTGSDTIGVLMDRAARAIQDKNVDLALRFLDAVTDLAPDYAEGWNRRAYVHYLRNDLERMAGDLRRCLALEPNHYRALEGLAQVMRDTGDKKAALKAYRRLLDIHPNASGAQDAVKDLSRAVEGERT
jgi:tetratricopeptide (TPR) repeat protein